MGHCMGGRMAMLGAGRLAEFRGLVVCYGGGVHLSWGNDPPPFETLRNIRCPVIGCYGKLDTNPSLNEVDQMDAELTRHGVAPRVPSLRQCRPWLPEPQSGHTGRACCGADSWEKTLLSSKR